MTRTEIVQAAFKVWGDDYYHTMSLSTLSASLGVTKAALYHHFRSKEEILDTMYDTFFEDISDCLRT
ncbi:MAG: TetR/AcrR family transcriptional regulator, partial [Spirochaetaceae bacterium]|nr:TetR/AcrR family transcriptional regulator [Spirochaetaceae bacterium]